MHSNCFPLLIRFDLWLVTPSFKLNDRLCMEHINKAIENMNNTTSTKDEENLSIIERIMIKTGNPKIAAVLALDLFLVGVDTVSNMHCIWMKIYHHTSAFNVCGHMLKHTCDSIHTPCGVCLLCTHSGLCTDKFLSFFSFHTNAFFKLEFFFCNTDVSSCHINHLPVKSKSWQTRNTV